MRKPRRIEARGLSRRRLMTAAAGGLSGLMVSSVPVPSLAATPTPPADPLELDPYAPPRRYWEELRPLFFSQSAMRQVVERLISAYRQEKEARLGEWMLYYAYIWWRTAPEASDRLKIAKAGRRLSRGFSSDHPDHVAGHLFAAVFTGVEQLTRGVLETLQMIPSYRDAMEAAVARDESYNNGLPLLLQAIMYIKLPPFPVSVGDPQKGRAYLERAGEYMRGRYALWYLYAAEADLGGQGASAAFDKLERMRREVEPVDVNTAYVYDATRTDAERLRRAVEAGRYDKYRWDPLMEPQRPGAEAPGP